MGKKIKTGWYKVPEKIKNMTQAEKIEYLRSILPKPIKKRVIVKEGRPVLEVIEEVMADMPTINE